MTPASLPRVSSDGPSVVVGMTEKAPKSNGMTVEEVSAEAPITPRVEVPSRPSLEAAHVEREPEPQSLEAIVTEAAENADVNPDEISIPPVVEPFEAAPDSLPEEDEHFFAAGERLSQLPVPDDEWEDPAAETLKRKSMPYVAARRERFSRVVKWVAGGAAILCALAAARAIAPGHTPSPATAAAAAAKIEAPARAAEPPRAEPARVEAPKVDVPAVVVAPEAPAAEPPKEVVAADPEAAKADKKIAQKALERGKLADAIEAGERSVAADPTDSEAWLILGASYQEKGKIAEAKRCYRACIEQGKRGPKGECAAMLR